jgi:transcriptional regulator with XRE-family HTH domain
MTASISEVFREQIRRRRRLEDWTQQDVSEKLAALGVHMDPTAITRLEKGSRGVSLEEALALAVVLKMSPFGLCAPPDNRDVAIAPGLTVTAYTLRKWFIGAGPPAAKSDTPPTSSPVSEVSDTSGAVTDLTDVTAPGTSEQASETGWTPEAIKALGATTNVRTAATVLGIGERLAYESIKRGDWPTRVLRLGNRVLIPTHDLLSLLYGPNEGGK